MYRKNSAKKEGRRRFVSSRTFLQRVSQFSRKLIGKINHFGDVDTRNYTEQLPAELQEKVTIHDNSYYIGENPQTPQTGDVLVSFKSIEPLNVSLISRQIGNTLEPYYGESGQQIELLEIGTLSAESMFEIAKKENSIITWILLFVGFVLLFFGLLLIFNPLSVLADVIPFLGNVVDAGIWLGAFLLALALSLLTISIAWLGYRPLISVPLLVVVGMILAAGLKYLPKQKT